MQKKNIIALFFLLNLFEVKANKAQTSIALKTIEWNNAMNNMDLGQLRTMYEDNVVCYGKYSSLRDALIRKKKYYSKYEDYRQDIVSDFTISTYGNGIYKCEFLKEGTAAKITKKYPSYLIFRERDGDFKIIEESDEVTNSKLNYQPQLGKVKSVEVVYSNPIKTETKWPAIIGIGGVLLVAVLVFLYINRIEGSGAKKKIKVKHMAQPAAEYKIANGEDANEKSKRMGLEFEEFIVECFNKKYYKILEWQSDKFINGRYALNSMNPDLVMRLQLLGEHHDLAIECKFRKTIGINGRIEFCEQRQLDNYKKFGHERKMNVFLALGIGGEPNKPMELYIIPIEKLKTNSISNLELKKYSKRPGGLFYYDLQANSLT